MNETLYCMASVWLRFWSRRENECHWNLEAVAGMCAIMLPKDSAEDSSTLHFSILHEKQWPTPTKFGSITSNHRITESPNNGKSYAGEYARHEWKWYVPRGYTSTNISVVTFLLITFITWKHVHSGHRFLPLSMLRILFLMVLADLTVYIYSLYYRQIIFSYNLEDVLEKINKLEAENVKMREEFNVQRAKMKELFLQKEGESVWLW